MCSLAVVQQGALLQSAKRIQMTGEPLKREMTREQILKAMDKQAELICEYLKSKKGEIASSVARGATTKAY
jgi:hypothetical protein